MAACLPIGIVGLVSAIHQGKTAVASIGIVAKKPDQFGKAMLFPAMVETCLLYTSGASSSSAISSASAAAPYLSVSSLTIASAFCAGT